MVEYKKMPGCFLRRGENENRCATLQMQLFESNGE